MRRSLIILLVVGLVLISTVGALAESLTIKLGHGMPPVKDESIHVGVMAFKNFVETQSGGEITVEVYPSHQLGSEREMVEGVQMGSVEMAVVAEGPIAGFFPEIQVFGIPYLFANSGEAWKVLDGEFSEKLFDEMLKRTGINVLAVGENGFRNFTNSVREIRTPEDLKGLKIRTMEIPAHMKMVNAMGASATPIAWDEVYMSLQQGVVDGQENPVSVIEIAKFYEVQEYLTLDGHVYSILPLIANDQFLQQLTDEQRKLINDGAEVYETVQRAQNLRHVQEGLEILEDEGMKIYTPNSEELEKFREASQDPVIDFINKSVDEKWINGVLKAAEEVK